MRVALLTRAVFGLHGYGGMERHVLELARFLAAAGVRPTIVTMPPTHRVEWAEPGVELQIVSAARLPLRGIPDRVTNYPYWSRLAGQKVAEQDFDVVHAQGLSGWGYSRLLEAGKTRAPLIIAPQGMEEFKTTPAKRMAYAPFHLLARQAAARAAALIAADSAAAVEIPRFLRVPANRVVLIPNGIDMAAAREWINPQVQQMLAVKYSLQQKTPIMLSVGRLEENKGFRILIDALARIRPALPSKWRWLLAGTGPQRAQLEAAMQQHRLGEHGLVLGAVDDLSLHNLYEMSHLFVHPTLFEGSSLVTLEAMAHCRPIVATTVGGIPDKVQRGRNGYLVAPGDGYDLGEKILLALRDPKRLQEMGDASFAIVRQNFDWPRTISLTLDLYGRVTGRPAPPRPPRARPHEV